MPYELEVLTLWLVHVQKKKQSGRHRRKLHRHINPLNTELNPICHLLALFRAHHIFHVSGLRDKRGLKRNVLLNANSIRLNNCRVFHRAEW